MKRFLLLFLSLSLVLSLIGGMVSFGAEDIVFYESFENGLSDWSFGKEDFKENFAVVKDASTDGKASLKIIDNRDDASISVVSKAFKAEAGCNYTIKADFNILEGTGASGKIYLRFKDASGKILASKSKTSSGNKWETVENTVFAPDGTENGEIVITGQKEYSGITLVDNIKVLKGEAVAVDAPEVSTVIGVVHSESFENGLGTWKSYSDATVEKIKITDEKASDGKKSTYILDDSDSASTGIMSGLIPVNGLSSYIFQADLLVMSGTVKMYFRCYNKEKTKLDTKSYGVSASGEWRTGKITVDLPSEAAYAELIITADMSVIADAYADNIKLINNGALIDNPNKKMQMDLSSKLAKAKPGDIITIPDGIYNDIEIDISVSGEEGKPITLKAENPGKVKFTGNSYLRFNGSYIVVSDLCFEKCTTLTIIRFDDNSKYCQLKDCAVINCDPENLSDQQKWVYICGKYNKVTGCYLRGKTARGMMAEVIRRTAEADYHTIENCYFGDYKLGSANGLETIRIGTSTQSLSGSYSTVSGCFFESCDGEVETISVKSGNNFVINNTLYNNKGAIVLRHGNGTLVEGNLVIGGDPTSRITGVRVIGEDHTVKNNYFYNTPLDSQVMYVSNGNPDPLIDEYLLVKNLDMSNNTVIAGDCGLVPGEYAPSTNNGSNRILPPEGKIENNAILSYKGNNPLILNAEPNRKISFSGNVAYGKALGYEGEVPSGISYENFGYTVVDGFVVPDNNKGANIEIVKKAPKSPFDVMPQWVKTAYYDTGIIKFTPVKADPFNTEFKVEDLLPQKGKINVVLNGYRKTFDVDPQLINSRTMVPMRAIFEEFGTDIEWDEKTATATAKTSKVTVKITENSDKAYVNNKEVTLDSPAVIINGRFLVPLRFVSESFGAKVGWADETETAIINLSVSQSMTSKDVYEPLHKLENALSIHGAVLGGFNEEGNDVKCAFDGNFGTKWTTKKDDEGVEGYGIFDLASSKTLEAIHIAFGSGNKRNYKFTVEVSDDGKTFTKVIDNGVSSGKSEDLEAFSLNGAKGRYIKITGHGNQDNGWNNYNEIVITGK